MRPELLIVNEPYLGVGQTIYDLHALRLETVKTSRQLVEHALGLLRFGLAWIPGDHAALEDGVTCAWDHPQATKFSLKAAWSRSLKDLGVPPSQTPDMVSITTSLVAISHINHSADADPGNLLNDMRQALRALDTQILVSRAALSCMVN